MCGIVGYITVDNNTQEYVKEKFFEEALYMNALRGSHSTGIMSVSEEFRWAWAKQAVSAAEYIDGKTWSKRESKNWCSVGHGRHATVGEINCDNAHPFQHGEIILVHNGTLRTIWDLPHKSKDIKVDSELIAYNLSLVEPDKAVEIIEKLQGAYALVWFDERDKSVNMVRNHERPLHLGINRQEDSLFFMSDGNMLHAVGQRLMVPTNGPSRIWQIATHQILKYKKGNLVPEVTEVRPFARRSTYIPTTRTKTHTGVVRHKTGGTYSKKVNPEDIPKVHLEMMKDWYMIDPAEEYYFEPKGHINWGKNEGLITGVVYHPEWDTYLDVIIPSDAHTQKAPPELLLDYEGPWSILLTGVSHCSYVKDSSELTFIGKVKWYTWPASRPTPKENIVEHDEGTEVAICWFEKVQGPHGEIDVPAFEALVGDGCAMCSMPVLPEEAEKITWVGEMSNQPLCENCLDDWCNEWSSGQ